MARRVGGPRPREIDDAATRLVARLRVLPLTAITLAAALILDDSSHPAVQYGLAFFVVPGAVALALAADRLVPWRCAAAGAVLDVATFAVGVATFPEHAGTFGAAFLVAVMVASYTGGRVLGASVGLAGVLILAAVDARSSTDLDFEAQLLLTLGVVVCLAVVGRADARLLRTAGRATYHEARATLLLEHVTEAICVTDGAGAVTLLNDAAKSLLQTETPGSDCAAVLGLQVDGEALDCSRGCGLLRVAGSSDPGGVEARSCAPGRSAVPVLASAAEVVGSDGRVSEVIHTLRDITRLKLADEAKTLFLATATHELKTPLTVIRGFLDTIQQPGVGDDVKERAVGIMRVRATELSSIIERLLLASRIEAGGGGITIPLAPVDVAEVARERVSALAGATGRPLHLQAPDATPKVLGDESSLATVVDHLLDNACKYSAPASPVEITVDVDEATVAVSIRDAGEGMTAEQVAHCFDRFWQADPTSRRRVGGTGIGLYIVRSLATSMQGRVTVASTLGEGTTFTLTLPRADAPPTPTSTSTGSADAGASDVPQPSIVLEFMRQIGVEPAEHKESRP